MECRFMNLDRGGSIRKLIRSDEHLGSRPLGSLLCEGKAISGGGKNCPTGFNLMNNVTSLVGLGPQ